MNKIYECMVLLDNREVRQGWDAVKDSVATMLTKHNAEVVSSKLWEERRLAYPINNQQRGTYLLVYFNAPTAEIAPINREMNMAGLVLRHTVSACEEVPESANEPEKEFDVTKIGTEEAAKPEPQAADGADESAAGEEAPADAPADAPAEVAAKEDDAPAAEEPAADAPSASEDAPAEEKE